MKGVKIGVTKDISYTDEFLKAGKDGTLTFEEVVKNDLQLEKLLNNRIDMVPLNTQATLYELKLKAKSDKVTYLPKALKSKPYFNTFVKKSDYPNLVEIEKKYDEVLKQMKSDGTLKKILEKYGM